MKQNLLLFLLVIIMISCNNASESETTTTSDADSSNATTNSAKEWIAVDSATAMKNWEAYATPGEPHKMLAMSDGEWDAEVSSWMADGAPPMTSRATATNKMIMDGRYQLSEFKGDMMGMSFTGMSILGYDNSKKVFVSTWVDNMGTGMMKMEGPWDEASKSMTLTGTMVDPSTGQVCNMREVFTITDDNNQKMEMYGPDPQTGKEMKSMEIKFTRKK